MAVDTTMSRHPRLARRATRVALLAVAAVLISAGFASSAGALPKISSSKFKSATTCTCHDEQFNDWRYSMHAKALFEPVYVLKKGQANEASDGALGPFCDTCHTPIGTMAGQTTGKKKLSAKSKEGVTCDFCHQVNGTTSPIGNGSQKVKANGTKRAQYKDCNAPSHASAYSEFHTTAEFCGACHVVRHPVNGLTLDSTYLEWKAGPYAALGMVCQDCHMSVTPGGGPSTGLAAALGPIRSYVYRMSFVGANVALGNPAEATKFLQHAATVSLDVPEVIEKGSAGKVTVKVTNVGAGHYIPGGAAEIRQMWLEVNAVAGDGTKKLLGRRQFGTVLKDAAGKYPAEIWNAVAVQSDDRIPPKESVSSTYELEMTTTDAVSVEAVLNYKSFPDDMAKKAHVRNPVTEMARATQVVYGTPVDLRRATWMSQGPPGWLIYCVVGLVVILVALGFTFARRRRRRASASDVGPYPTA